MISIRKLLLREVENRTCAAKFIQHAKQPTQNSFGFSARKGNFLFTNYFNLTTTIMVIINRNEYASVNSSAGCNALREMLSRHNAC